MIWTQLVCHCSVSLCLVPLSLSLLTIHPCFQRARELVSAQHLDRFPALLACGRVSGLGTLTTQHHAVGTQIDTSIWLSILICTKHKGCYLTHIFTLREKYKNKITFHQRVPYTSRPCKFSTTWLKNHTIYVTSMYILKNSIKKSFFIFFALQVHSQPEFYTLFMKKIIFHIFCIS